MGTYIRKVGSKCLDGYLYLWGTCIRWVLILPRIRYRFSSERNASVTSEIVKSITNENYSLSLVRSEFS